MGEFRIINEDSTILSQTDSNWVQIDNFKSQNKIVEYNGSTYQILFKDARYLSTLERFGRMVLAIVALVCTLGIAYAFESVRLLLTLKKFSIKYAIASNLPKIPTPQTQNLEKVSLEHSSGQLTDPKAVPEPTPAHESKPKRVLPQLGELLGRNAKEQLASAIKMLKPEVLYDLGKGDQFHLSLALQTPAILATRLKMIFQCFIQEGNDAKIAAFLKGYIQSTVNRSAVFFEIVKYIVLEMRTEEVQKKLLEMLCELMDQNGRLQWYKILKEKFHSAAWQAQNPFEEFIRFIAFAALKKDDYAERLLDLKKGFEHEQETFYGFLRKALAQTALDAFLNSITISEWKKLQEWGEKNSVKVATIPDNLVTFQKIKHNKKELFPLIDKIMQQGIVSVNELKPIFLELEAEEIAAYLNESQLFSQGLKNDLNWQDNFLIVCLNTPKEKQEKLLALALPPSHSTLHKATLLLNKLQGSLYNDQKYKDQKYQYVKELVKKAHTAASAYEFLQTFKATRHSATVSGVLSALTFQNGDGFKAIAEEITDQELESYIAPEKDFFGLKKTTKFNPLVGILNHLPAPKLKLFLEAILKLPYTYNQDIFLNLISTAVSLDVAKQQEIFTIISKWLLTSTERKYIFLPPLAVTEANVKFFGYYLVYICGLSLVPKEDALMAAFTTNESLFEAALKQGLQHFGASPEDEKNLSKWFNAKLEDSKKLRELITETEIKEAFKKCRAKPDHVRALLRDINNKFEPRKLSILAPEMTLDEIGIYSTMNINSFDISPGSYNSHKELLELFRIFKKEDALRKLIVKTIMREDTIDSVGLYVASMVCINSLNEKMKNELFKTLHALLLENKFYDDFEAGWMQCNDGIGGKVMPAAKAFAKYLKEVGKYSDEKIGSLQLAETFNI